PARFVMLQALSTLQRRGLVSVWDHGGFYDSYIPTAAGTSGARRPPPETEASAAVVPAEEARPVPAPGAAGDVSQAIVERLDEIIRLLRALNRMVGGS